MLSIIAITEEGFQFARQTIGTVDRLDELVDLSRDFKVGEYQKSLVIDGEKVISVLDWYDFEPPYIFPSVQLTEENLLALIFYKLGNQQRALEIVNNDNDLREHLFIASCLQYGYAITSEMLDVAQKDSKHNLAILNYYGILDSPVSASEQKELFANAIEQAKNDEEKLFTVKHYMNMLIDGGELQQAKQLVSEYTDQAISEEANFAMTAHLASIRMAGLQIPYDLAELDEVLALQTTCVEHYENRGLFVKAGLQLMDAAEVANFKEDFAFSNTLINKAIGYFKEADIPEFLGEAGLKKAVLLYTWSKNGSPQYYKAAINAFQDVLKVFKRDTHPQKFADVHHYLALIYSEMPVGDDEKPMWTAFCASSFKEALAFYSKEAYPYEFAMVSHNYATALMNFPPAKLHDNLAKADNLFEEALDVREAGKYPLERALTLLNQLELNWLSHNENQQEEQEKYQRMKRKAEELRDLTNDDSIREKAEDHLSKLEQVKSLI